MGAQYGSRGIASIQGQVGPSPKGHLKGGNSLSWWDTGWQCLVHTETLLWVSVLQELLQQVRIKQGCGSSSWLGTRALWAGVAPADSTAGGGSQSKL